MFAPGTFVIAVGSKEADCFAGRPGPRGYGDERAPRLGTVYTVREFFHSPYIGEPALFLDEVRNSERWYSSVIGPAKFEVHWCAKNFRPLDDSKLSIFRKALTDLPVGEDA